MTSNQPNIIKASADLDISAADLWAILTTKKTISEITGFVVRTDISDNNGAGNGVITVGRGVFFARYAPYEAELNSTQAKLKLRVIPTNYGCRVAVAASLPKNSILALTSERLQGFLNNLSIYTNVPQAGRTELSPPVLEEPAGALKTVYDAERQGPTVSAVDSATESSAEESTPFDAALAERESPTRIFKAKAEQPVFEKSKPRRRRGLRVLTVFTLLIAFAFLAGSILAHFEGMKSSTHMSAGVSFDSVREIVFGMSKNRVAFLLGTNGVKAEYNQIHYSSVTSEGKRRPDSIISVTYDAAGRAESVSYLDCEASISVFKIIDFNAEVTPGMTVKEVADELSLPFSLYRRYYSSDGSLMEEVHFGYLDPTANFNPAWRGEFEVIFNRTKNKVSVKNWGWYDGSDPTMIGSIQNTPFANQYDDYTDFLNDRFQFSRSRLLLNGYSLGDTKYFFDGEPVHYSNDFGYQFFSVDSAEKTDDLETPLYRISIGYDSNGAFQMASFSNMRLYNKAGTLKDSDYRLITRGMSYSEIRSLMRLVPTAMYVDADFFSVCYGRFLDTDVADEQFEVIIRFDHDTSHAQRVLVNAAVSGAADAESASNG